jgi:translation initiation factor IF-2
LAEKKLVGKITHYFDKIGVGVIELSAELKEGDKILVELHDGTSFEQIVSSMQLDKEPVRKAKKGDAIGIKLEKPCRNATVYKI